MVGGQRLALLLASGLLLAGCAGPFASRPAADEQTVAIRDARLLAIGQWQAQGSLAIDSEADGVFHTTFSWQSTLEGYDIRLFGPLGKQAFRVSQDRYSARVQRNDEPQEFGLDADELIARAAGVRIPVVAMQQWALGLAGEGQQLRRDYIGRLLSMRVVLTDGRRWDLRFSRYRAVDGVELPGRIEATSPGLEIVMVVSKRGVPSGTDQRLRIPGIES